MKVIAMHQHYPTHESAPPGAALSAPRDEDAEKDFLETMDEAGVEKAVLLGNVALESTIKFAQAHPDRIIGFAYVDPRRKDAPQLLDKYISKDGLAGLKVLPSAIELYPNDETIYLLYEKASELDIPVMIEPGGSGRHRAKYNQPIFIDDVARDFPDLRIIIVHAGKPMIEQTMMLARCPNVCVETSFGYDDLVLATEWMRKLLHDFRERRVLFGGSDHDIHGVTYQIERTNMVLDELSVSQSHKEVIFFKNAERVLKGE